MEPDAWISHILQLSYDNSSGHGQVKVEEYATDKLSLAMDLIKLMTFNKDTIDERKIDGCFAFPAVGE
jgi:hypothetical protein